MRLGPSDYRKRLENMIAKVRGQIMGSLPSLVGAGI